MTGRGGLRAITVRIDTQRYGNPVLFNEPIFARE